MQDEASYTCDHCGEEIVIPIDLSARDGEEFVEDCPVCCHPHVLRLHVDPGGEAWVDSEAE